MARVTDAGTEGTTLPEYGGQLAAALRRSIGSDLDLSDETPQGQLIGTLALAFTEADEAIIAISNALSLSHAVGRQLDDLGSIFGINRYQAARSTVTLTFSGTAGAIIPAGFRASDTVHQFETINDGTIGAGGTVDIAARSLEFGAIAAGAGTINTVETQLVGVSGVTNSAAATAGRLRETDYEYRQRYRARVGRNASSSLEALRAAIAAVPGVTRLAIFENATASPVTFRSRSIAANSFLAVVDGGTNAAVAAAIEAAKPLGIVSSGTVSETVNGETIRFNRVTAVPIVVTVTTDARAGFPPDGVTRMQNSLVEFIEEFGIGVGLATANPLYGPLYTIPEHSVSAVTAARRGGGLGIDQSNIPADNVLTLAVEDITITIS